MNTDLQKAIDKHDELYLAAYSAGRFDDLGMDWAAPVNQQSQWGELVRRASLITEPAFYFDGETWTSVWHAGETYGFRFKV